MFSVPSVGVLLLSGVPLVSRRCLLVRHAWALLSVFLCLCDQCCVSVLCLSCFIWFCMIWYFSNFLCVCDSASVIQSCSLFPPLVSRCLSVSRRRPVGVPSVPCRCPPVSDMSCTGLACLGPPFGVSVACMISVVFPFCVSHVLCVSV